MLQGRLFAYGDAQRYRLGVNHAEIPVNAPRCPVHMRVDGNHGGRLGYEPNSYGEWPDQPAYAEPALPIQGEADHRDHRDDEDYYSQPGLLFRLMNAEQKQALFDNTARSMGDAPDDIKIRHVQSCMKADPAYGEGVARALGIPWE